MAHRRQVVEIPGVPASMAVKMRNILFSSSIVGTEPATSALGVGAERQFDLAFLNMKRLVEQAGLALANIAHVTVFIRDGSFRQFINKPWRQIFPDDHDRPARKTTACDLPKDVLVQLQVTAVAAGQRQLLEIPGLAHRDPLPMGVKIGNLVFSSVIGGQDPQTNKQVDGTKRQIEQAFHNMRALVQQAGGSARDIAHVWVFLRDKADQQAMVESWLKMFPDDGDRPARKTIMYDELKGRETLIQLQFTAVVGGRRQNYEISGVGHHDPIPMGAKLGNMLLSSGIGGYDPKTGKRGEGIEHQSELVFHNMRGLVEQAGGTTGDIGHVTVLLKDFSMEPAVNRKWLEMFPGDDDRPARHVMTLGLPGENLVQLHMVAVLQD